MTVDANVTSSISIMDANTGLALCTLTQPYLSQKPIHYVLPLLYS